MPTATFALASQSDMAFLSLEGASYPPSTFIDYTSSNIGGTQAGRNVVAGPSYEIRNTLLRFDTSSLPDTAVISGASLWAITTGLRAQDSRNLTADFYTWSNPVSSSDITATAQTGAINGYPLASILSTTGTPATIPLDSVSGISKSGYTYLRLHASGGQPSVGENYWNFADYTTATYQEPQLIVYYDGEGPGNAYIAVGP